MTESKYETNWEYNSWMCKYEIEVEYMLHIDWNDKHYGPYSEVFKGSFDKFVTLVQNKPIERVRILFFEIEDTPEHWDVFQKLTKLIENGLILTRKIKNKYRL